MTKTTTAGLDQGAIAFVRALERIVSRPPGSSVGDDADEIVAEAGRFMADGERADALLNAVRDRLPDTCVTPGLASLLGPILYAASHPNKWSLVEEQFRGDVEDLLVSGGSPSAERAEWDRRLPILIAARDEARALPRTLRSMAPAVREFRSRFPDIPVVIVVCDNASKDDTAEVVTAMQKEMNRDGIDLRLLVEPRPGKVIALRWMLRFVSQSCSGSSRIVFADADVDWTPWTLCALWEYLDGNPGTDVVGSSILPRDGSLGRWNVWGVLDTMPFLDFGGPQARGIGAHMRFISGMTYMCVSRVAEARHRRIPLSTSNEDVALSYLTGVDRLAVTPNAVVRYGIPRSFRDLLSIKYRHVRGCIQLEAWAVALETSKAISAELEASGGAAFKCANPTRMVERVCRRVRREARRSVAQVCDLGTFSIARSIIFGRHHAPIQNPDGSVRMKRGVPLFLSFTHFVAIVVFMLPVYTVFKIAARADLRLHPNRRGWIPTRDAGGSA